MEWNGMMCVCIYECMDVGVYVWLQEVGRGDLVKAAVREVFCHVPLSCPAMRLNVMSTS